MPRPGPRPYECVRRAWHSDRHHPIRGSLIQEIFRVVNEIHSPATRKNKEWQEKLPIVVLKAEEIMYSKANSEAEYMDIKTLWDRANDAINTIIRRDETTETGELLQPCIEAALNLGCTPRRASRSQRNSNPRCYLSPNNQGPTLNTLSSLDNTTHGIHAINSEYSSHYLNLVKKSSTTKLTHFGTEPLCHIVAQQNNCTNSKFPFSFSPSSNNHCSPLETCPASKAYTVYPLFYGNNLNCNKSQFDSGIPSKLNSNAMEPDAEISIMQNQFSYNLDASNKTIRAEFNDTSQNQQPEIEFDLSLRLGPLSVPCTSIENNLPREVEDVSSISTSREGSKSGDPSPQMKNGFSFFLRGNADDPLDSCSSKRSPTDSTIRKRKAIVCPPIEERQFCSQAKAFISTLLEE